MSHDPAGFTIKDSGKRENMAGGMIRDTEDGKTDYTLILDGPMFDRWAEHLTKGAKKYEARNWMKSGRSDNPDEVHAAMQRFKRSALRHLRQWLRGQADEDHAAAVFFNINGYEYLYNICERNALAGRPGRPASVDPPGTRE